MEISYAAPLLSLALLWTVGSFELMSKLRVGIIFGGRSAEHEVSLQSAKNIVDALDRSRFEPVLIGIDKQGHWHLNDPSNFLLNQENPALIALNQSNRELAVVPGKASQQLVETSSQELLGHVDVIFPIVHGTLGEDGCLQGLLRMADSAVCRLRCAGLGRVHGQGHQ